jgi:hypothetical protein
MHYAGRSVKSFLKVSVLRFILVRVGIRTMRGIFMLRRRMIMRIG